MKFPKHSIINRILAVFRHEEMILLESQLPGHPSSTCSFVAIGIQNRIIARDNEIEQVLNGEKSNFLMNPWEALSRFKEKNAGWLFGYFGYDLKNFVEELCSENPRISDVPDLCFMSPKLLLKITNNEVEVLRGEFNEQLMKEQDEEIDLDQVNHSFFPDITKEEYISKVLKIKAFIKNGNFYELNFSYPFKGRFNSFPYFLYKRMRAVNPVPFGAYINLGNYSVCCSSPERFLKKSGKKILSEPIKGTSERMDEIQLDKLKQRELLNEKNRAENLMIVDLVRHDLSKVSETGSVKVTRLYDVQSFGTVHQLISAIEAEIKEGIDSVEVIRSCFPMGSMTGAPKIEVMKKIEELESYRRGIYSGAIGYFTPWDDFDFNVVIRSAIIQNNQLVYPVGGAITSDSEPEKEWDETWVKAKNLTNIFSATLKVTK